MSTLFLIFNHHFTPEQEADARLSLGVNKIVPLPKELQERWRDIPPTLPALQDYLKPFRAWLADQATEGDYVLIQGDFGAVYLLVRFALEKGVIPVYSTTRREAEEEVQPDGTVKLTHHFEHRIFRRYGG
ncbi:MAG: CRISPR-associated protein Csx20 [Thermodesulfobacteriota bacterium]